MVFMILFYYRCLECHFCSIPWCCDQGMHIPLVPGRMEAHPGVGPCSHIHEEGGYSSLPEAAYGLTLPTFTRHPRRIPDIEGESQHRAPPVPGGLHRQTVDEPFRLPPIIMDRLPPGRQDQQWCRRWLYIANNFCDNNFVIFWKWI